MRFLSRFYSICRAWLAKAAHTEHPPVRRDESPTATLARYILQGSRISGGRVNHRAFLPPEDLELSTYNIDSLSDSDIWDIGHRVRIEQHKENLHGRADILSARVYEFGLR